MFETDYFQLVTVAVTFVTSYSLIGLLAIWVALGRRPHWWLRVAVWAGVVLSLLLIPAYEPVLLFSIQSLVAVVPLMAVRAWQERRRTIASADGSPTAASGPWRPQFHIRDLLLLTVLVAIVTAVVVHAPSDMWKFWDSLRTGLDPWQMLFRTAMRPGKGWAVYFLFGLGMGISTVAAAWVGLNQSRWWLRLAGLLLVPTSVFMAAWLVLIRATGRLSGGRSGSIRPLVRRSAQGAAGLLSLFILAPPVATFLLLVSPPPEPPLMVLPDPNGYDDLRRAGKALASVTVPEIDTATPQQLSAFVATYGNVLDDARIGLDRPCVVPVQYTMSDIDLDALQGLQQLKRAFRAEGEEARLRGQVDAAVRSYLDLFRLARAGSRGGLALNWLVGTAIEDSGIEAMIGLREDLNGRQCREIMNSLQKLDTHRERPDDVVARDEVWAQIVGRTEGWLRQWLWTIGSSDMELLGACPGADSCNRAQLRMLLCALALRCYRLDHGELPAALADLVPEYLPEVPVDPFSGGPLVYRREDGEYVLHSVGPDGCDDGGKPWQESPDETWTAPGTDIVLDPPEEAP